MKYTKISGTFLKFDSSQRVQTGIHYASQELKLAEGKLVVRTFMAEKIIETELFLVGHQRLEFKTVSDDPKIPIMTGKFFDADYEECVMKSALPDQNIVIDGVVSKLDKDHGLSTKTLVDASSGKVIGIMQERVELISQEVFEKAVSHAKSVSRFSGVVNRARNMVFEKWGIRGYFAAKGSFETY